MPGKTLETLADWYWYSSSCGGTTEGIGSSLFASPAITTDYYVRAEGICNTTSCLDISITVNDTSAIQGSIISATSTTICESDTTTLTVAGGNTGTLADWYWYSSSCGGTNEGID